jgi:hypothetical protein
MLSNSNLESASVEGALEVLEGLFEGCDERCLRELGSWFGIFQSRIIVTCHCSFFSPISLLAVHSPYSAINLNARRKTFHSFSSLQPVLSLFLVSTFRHWHPALFYRGWPIASHLASPQTWTLLQACRSLICSLQIAIC